MINLDTDERLVRFEPNNKQFEGIIFSQMLELLNYIDFTNYLVYVVDKYT